MSNGLTGDFDAVLQISQGTVQRMLATMHQNAGRDVKLPSFPPLAMFRIGDERPWHGIRGAVRVQIGVPRIELFDHVTDRFALDVDIRARYRPDVGTEPLPEFIHGTMHAEYRLHDIDPSCPGWRDRAADYLWPRVVKDSVRFVGTALDELGPQALHVVQPDPALMNARITQLIAALLATRFEAVPQPVSARFRRGALISVGAGFGAAVAMPLPIAGVAAGSVNSIAGPLVNGRDIAVAIRREALLALAQPALDAVAAFSMTVKVHVSTPWPAPDIDTVYHVGVSKPTIDWIAGVPFVNGAMFRIKVTGSANTNSVLPNATFDVEQFIQLHFDAGAERLWLAPGSRNVTTHSSGLGSGAVADGVNAAVHKAVAAIVASACNNAQGALDAMVGRKSELVDQMRGFDDQAGARLDDCEFTAEGIVLRGHVALSPRRDAVVEFDETGESDGFSAFLSWIPGGRVERFEWSWRFYVGGRQGAANHDDRFLLRRPRGSRSRWGVMGLDVALAEPLPGLDGMGSLCLTIKGSRIDPNTGAWVPVQSRRSCTRFGVPINLVTPKLLGPLLLNAYTPARAGDLAEAGVIHAGPAAGSQADAGNTLVLHLGGQWSEELMATLQRGLEASRRNDAGLKVLVLLHGERAESQRRELARRAEELGGALGAMVIVDEDRSGRWAQALAVDAGRSSESWRLLAPGGGVTWMHDDRIEAGQLAHALDNCLVPSAPPRARALSPLTRFGDRLRPDALREDLGVFDAVARCPPSPLGRTHHRVTVVSFVQAGSAASAGLLRELARADAQPEADAGDDDALSRRVLLVVGGTDREGLEAIKNQLGVDFDAIADSDGRLAERFGVRMWPTTISVQRGGVVSGVDVGWQSGDAEKCYCD